VPVPPARRYRESAPGDHVCNYKSTHVRARDEQWPTIGVDADFPAPLQVLFTPGPVLSFFI